MMSLGGMCMENKMSNVEKICEIVAITLIILSVIFKCIVGVNDTDTLVMLAFLGVMLFVIFLVCAFFPADWRMTEKQKEKIEDMDLYQAKYRKVFAGINALTSVFVCCLIFFCYRWIKNLCYGIYYIIIIILVCF